jgi:hypothetical protein
LEWIQKVEKVFEWYEYSEERKCKVAALEFTDYALLWWENLKIQRRRDGEEEITTWETMKRVMKKRFVPDYYKQELYIRLQTLRQRSLSVEEYITNVVELQPYIFLEEVIKLATRVERQQKRGGV